MWTVFGKGYNKVQAFKDQIHNFCNAISGTDKLLITSEDALASVDAIETAYESLNRDDWVSVPTDPMRGNLAKATLA